MAEFTKPTNETLEARFGKMLPAGDQIERLELLRTVTEQYAKDIVELTPVSPEQSRALNALDEAWSLAKLAMLRNEKR